MLIVQSFIHQVSEHKSSIRVKEHSIIIGELITDWSDTDVKVPDQIVSCLTYLLLFTCIHGSKGIRNTKRSAVSVLFIKILTFTARKLDVKSDKQKTIVSIKLTCFNWTLNLIYHAFRCYIINIRRQNKTILSVEKTLVGG